MRTVFVLLALASVVYTLPSDAPVTDEDVWAETEAKEAKLFFKVETPGLAGAYWDKKDGRVFEEGDMVALQFMPIRDAMIACQFVCKMKGQKAHPPVTYQYFALQESQECWCGKAEANFKKYGRVMDGNNPNPEDTGTEQMQRIGQQKDKNWCGDPSGDKPRDPDQPHYLGKFVNCVFNVRHRMTQNEQKDIMQVMTNQLARNYKRRAGDNCQDGPGADCAHFDSTKNPWVCSLFGAMKTPQGKTVSDTCCTCGGGLTGEIDCKEYRLLYPQLTSFERQKKAGYGKTCKAGSGGF